MIKIDNLSGAREVLVGNSLDPFSPISQDANLLRSCHAAADSLGIDAIAKKPGRIDQ